MLHRVTQKCTWEQSEQETVVFLVGLGEVVWTLSTGAESGKELVFKTLEAFDVLPDIKAVYNIKQ